MLRAEVDCSSGTYVRTLAHDLGHALGGGAHLRNLRRTAIGSFTVDEAQPLDAVIVRPITEAMRDYPTVAVSEQLAQAVGHGKVLARGDLGSAAGGELAGSGPWAVVGPDGSLLAVYEAHGEATVKPAVVVAPAGGGG